MKFYVFFLIIFLSFFSCRTSNVLIPVCVDQNIQIEDGRIEFTFDLNEAFWDITVYNNSAGDIKVDFGKIRISKTNTRNTSDVVTMVPPAKGILYILPGTKNSKLLYPRYSIRKNLFTPKDIKNKETIKLTLYVPVEYSNETKEYKFEFMISACESDQRKYHDGIYN